MSNAVFMVIHFLQSHNHTIQCDEFHECENHICVSDDDLCMASISIYCSDCQVSVIEKAVNQQMREIALHMLIIMESLNICMSMSNEQTQMMRTTADCWNGPWVEVVLSTAVFNLKNKLKLKIMNEFKLWVTALLYAWDNVSDSSLTCNMLLTMSC